MYDWASLLVELIGDLAPMLDAVALSVPLILFVSKDIHTCTL